MLRILSLLVWIFALHAYLVLFVAFAASRKNELIRLSTMVSGLGVLWVFGMVSMKFGVAPSADFWFKESIFALSLIPCTIHLILRSMNGERIFTPYSIALIVISIAIAILTTTGFFYDYEVLCFDGSAIGPMMIDDLHDVVLTPRPGSILIVVGESLIILQCIIKGYSIKGFKYRKLFIIISMLYWIAGLLSFVLPFALPFELLGGFGCILLLMAVLRDRNALNMKLFIKPQFFPALSGLFTMLLSVMLFFRSWGSFEEFKGAVLFPMFGSTLTVMITTILYEYLYERFFTDRANYLMQCSSAYNRNILETLGDVDVISSNFIAAIHEAFGDGVLILYAYDDENGYYALRSRKSYDPGSIPVDGDLARKIGSFPRTANASSLLEYLDEESHLYHEIWEGRIRWVTPMKVQDRLLGFYFIGGFKMKYIENMDKESIAAIVKTTALALQETYMINRKARNSRLDSLTGLNNMLESQARLQARLDSGKPFTVLEFSIDDIEFYNSVYSLAKGDELIKVFTATLKGLAGGTAVLGRISGKAFIALVDGDGDEGRILDERLRSGFKLANEMTIRSSMSFSTGLLKVHGNEGYTPDEVIAHTEIALHDAKRSGKNQLMEYSEELVDITEDGATEFRMHTVDAITKAIDLKDHFTYGHSINVAYYSRAIAEAAGLSPLECETIFQSGLVHDIGKISIPDSVLMNPGKLTSEEYEIIKTHVERSEDVIRTLPLGSRMLPIALSHHERWDGKGYPNGLGGLDIPIGGRCLAIADTFDAMTSRRVYRKALSVDEALSEIERCSGTQFDPDLGPLFVELVRSGRITPHPYL